jgi:hypothetical protein
MTKEKYIHLGLIAALALAVLWYLMRQKSSGTSQPIGATGANAAPSYPSVPAAIKLGDINIGQQVPPYLTYNHAAPNSVNAEISDGPNSACDCGTKSQPVNYPTVAANVYQSSLENFQSFLAKVA